MKCLQKIEQDNSKLSKFRWYRVSRSCAFTTEHFTWFFIEIKKKLAKKTYRLLMSCQPEMVWEMPPGRWKTWDLRGNHKSLRSFW